MNTAKLYKIFDIPNFFGKKITYFAKYFCKQNKGISQIPNNQLIMEIEKFKEILKNRIKEYGFTQKSFAETIGMTQPQVNNIVSGRETGS